MPFIIVSLAIYPIILCNRIFGLTPNYYWNLLKSLNDDIKLRLATRLTASVLEHRKNETTTDLTEEMLDKHIRKWIDDRSTEEIISDMRNNRSA